MELFYSYPGYWMGYLAPMIVVGVFVLIALAMVNRNDR